MIMPIQRGRGGVQSGVKAGAGRPRVAAAGTAPCVSVERMRDLLGTDGDGMTDAEVADIRDSLLTLADLLEDAATRGLDLDAVGAQ